MKDTSVSPTNSFAPRSGRVVIEALKGRLAVLYLGMPRSIPPLILSLAASIWPSLAFAQRIVPPPEPQPVIQDVRLVFSMVGHRMHFPDRVNFYNTYGIPAGNNNYVVPHLVCDPLVTLYNPYPDPLTVSRVSVRLWDPPVAFRFKKNGIYLRPEFEAGEFLGLARFQINNESNPDARKTFTLCLRQARTNGSPGVPITLQPGESRTFATWVEPNWTWGYENANTYNPRSFFDWTATNDFTNVDGRTGNPIGVEMIAASGATSLSAWDPRAGYQWDYLASVYRPIATRYEFETKSYGGQGWVAVKNEDTFTVEAKALRVVASASEPDFRLTLNSVIGFDPESYLHQDFRFTVAAIDSGESAQPVSRTFVVGDLLQSATDITPGGKRPFAALTLSARRGSLLNSALQQFDFFNGDEHYHVRFDAMNDFSTIALIGEEEVHADSVSKATPLATAIGSDGLFHFLTASPTGVAGWKVMGGTLPGTLEADLTDTTSIVPMPSGPMGAKLDRISIDTSTLGSSYFFRLEGPPAPAP